MSNLSDFLPVRNVTGLDWADPVNANLVPETDSLYTIGEAAKRFTNAYLDALDIAGNITVGGTVDGRDIATDGAKLDGVEAGATADQTGAEIKSLYEAEANTNAFTDAEQTKLSGIEALADVTDFTNVSAALAAATGAVSFNSQVISSLGSPSLSGDAATKGYVDALVQGLEYQESVASRFDPTSGLPGTPTTGDRYISTATANGWTVNNIYEYNGATWDATVPTEGTAAWVEDEDVLYTFNGTSWVKFGSTLTHANLLQLTTSDDHTQYVHNTTARTISANHNFTGAPAFSNIDVNGGAIDATPIGAVSASTLRGTSLQITGGGAWGAGSIYGDANWSMLFRATIASPAQGEFGWYASNGTTEYMRITTTGNVVMSGGLTTAGEVLIRTSTSSGGSLTVGGTDDGGLGTFPTQEWHYVSNPANYRLTLNEIVTAANVAYSFTQENNTTVYSDVLVFKNGNVLLGTTTDAGVKLNVAGKAAATKFISGAEQTSDSGFTTKLSLSANYPSIIMNDEATSSKWEFGVNSLGELTALDGTNTRFTINAAGEFITGGNIMMPTGSHLYTDGSGTLNLGDGSDTIVVQNKLQVTGEAAVGAAVTSGTRLHLVDSLYTGSYLLRITADDAGPYPLMINNSTYSATVSDGLALYVDNSGVGNIRAQGTGSQLSFGTDSTERMRIASSGNLLIGTTTDSTTEQLQIYTSSTYGLSLDGDGNNKGIVFKVSGSVQGDIIQGSGSIAYYRFDTHYIRNKSNQDIARFNANGLHMYKAVSHDWDVMTDGAAITPNFTNSAIHDVTLGGNRSMTTPNPAPVAGQTGVIYVRQDATGSRTLTWSSAYRWPGSTAPTLSTGANAIDIFGYVVRSSGTIDMWTIALNSA